MSSISSVGGSSDLYELFKKFRSNKNGSASSEETTESNSADETGESSSSSKPKKPEEVMAEALKAQGLDDNTISEIQSQIDALKSSQSGSTSPSDMKDGINSILTQYGVDTDKVDSYMQANMPKGGRHGMGGFGGGMDSDGDHDNSLVGSTVDTYA